MTRGGENRDFSTSHPLPSLLYRPSFSLELYNRFSQDALNASLPDIPYADNNNTDMDVETDTDNDVMVFPSRIIVVRNPVLLVIL